MKQKMKIRTEKLFNHLHKVKRRHVEKFMHTRAHTHHAMIHIGELLVIGMVWFSSLLFANYNNSYQHLHRNSTQEITQSLAKAIEQQKQKTNESKIISVREMDGNVNNTFAPWYCTYGAARISPEFFPYSEDKMSQERTRWGNAIDRCENAEKAGFRIGTAPTVGSLIVYKKVGSNTTFWHVGKVMYSNSKYKSLIVRDMNWIAKFVMSDRWESADNENIKCYIYPWKEEKDSIEQSTWSIGTDKFTVWSGENQLKEQQPETNTKPEITPETPKTEEQPTHNAPENPINEEQPEINKEQQLLEKEIPNYDKQEFIIETNDNFSDISKHFLSQHEIKIVINKKDKLTVWDTINLEIHIINKETKEPYQWILPFMLNSISQNNVLEASLKTIQLLHSQWNIINFKAKEKGSSTILLTIDNQKIITIPMVIE